MAEARGPLAINVSLPTDGLQGRSRLEKLMHTWLDGDDEAEGRLKYVLWGPGGVGKSTLALKFAAAGGFTSCCSLRRGAGRGWRSSTTCPRRPTTSWRGPGSGG